MTSCDKDCIGVCSENDEGSDLKPVYLRNGHWPIFPSQGLWWILLGVLEKNNPAPKQPTFHLIPIFFFVKCKLEAINKWDNGCEKGRWQWNRHRRHFNWYRHCWHTNNNNRVTLQKRNSNLSHFEINFHIWAKTNLWVISHPFELSWISPKSQIRCHIWKRHGHRRAQIIIFVES